MTLLDRVPLAALNHLLAQAGWARQKLRPFSGRRAAIVVATLRLDFVVAADGLLQPASETPAEVVLRLPVDAPLRLPQGSEALFAAAHVEGPADFASALGFVFQHLEWDYEEDLARLFGDIIAHRLAGGLRSLLRWQREAAQRLVGNVAEYLTEERPLLLARAEFDRFGAELAAFDHRLRQAEARFARLSGRIGT